MQHAFAMLLSLACLAYSGEAASMKNRIQSHAESAIALLLRSEGPGKIKTKQVVDSLEEVAKGLQAEDKAAAAVAKASATHAKKTQADLGKAIEKGQRTIDRASDDQQKMDAEVKSLQADLAGVKRQITASNTELDNLQAKLKQIRTDKGELKKSASKALQQVEAVLEKTYLLERTHRLQGVAAMKKQVSSLEHLSESLSLLQTDAEQQSKSQVKQRPALILKADRLDVTAASEVTQKGFNEEEKKLLDLIEVEKKKLQDLEANMEELQPAISNKLQQFMEAGRTLQAASLSIDQDRNMLHISGDQGALYSGGLASQRKQRAKVVSDVLMASKLLQHMDTALFLARDIQGLKGHATSLIQLESVHAAEEAPAASSLPSFLQEADFSDGALVHTTALEESVDLSAATSGPFDKVSEMISGLIASLKAQANDDVNQHQFCQDNLSNNRRHRVEKKFSIDSLTATVQYSKIALVRLQDEMKYSEDEIERLKAFQESQSKALSTETTRVGKEISEHKLAMDVVDKVVVILNQLCNLGAAASFMQHKVSLKTSRFSQCKEASDLLKSAAANLKDLDDATQNQIGEYYQLSSNIIQFANDGQGDRESEWMAAKAAKAQRASELATADQDIREATKQLKLIDDSKKQLEHSCTHVETREERMARRKNELDALKEALRVLEGEAIPA